MLRLDSTKYEVTEAQKWGILTRGLIDVYKPIVRKINVSLEVKMYATLAMKLQELSREDVGDPNVPLELQRISGSSGSALHTTTQKKDYRT